MPAPKGPAAPLLSVGDRVRVNARGAQSSGVSATNGFRGHTVMTNKMSQPTGRVTKVVNRHLYYVELDEPLVAAFSDSVIEKI